MLLLNFYGWLTLLGLCICTPACGQCTYSVEMFGVSPCSTPNARALNDLASWVGYRETCAGHNLPLYHPVGGPDQLLPLPPGVISGTARAINDGGVVVGTYARPPYQLDTACIWWPDGGFTVIPPPPGGDRSYADSINGDGVVVGNRFTPAFSIPFIWSDGTLTEIDPSPFSTGFAQDISDTGYITGYFGNLDADGRAFRWKDAALALLPPVAGEAASNGRAVNSVGTVVGSSLTYLGPGLGYSVTPTVWTLDAAYALPLVPGYTGGGCFDINDSGVILGELGTPLAGGGFAYLQVVWIGGQAYSVADLLASPFPDLFSCWALNNAGQVIAGYGGGVMLLTPSPLAADLNYDCVVDGGDLALFLGLWGSSDRSADLNGDGVVNGADLGILLGQWSFAP